MCCIKLNGWIKDLLNLLIVSYFLTIILYNTTSGLISPHYLFFFNLYLCHTLKPFTLCRHKTGWSLTSHFSLDTCVESFFTAEWEACTMVRRPKQSGCSFISRSSSYHWVTMSSSFRQARKDGWHPHSESVLWMLHHWEMLPHRRLAWHVCPSSVVPSDGPIGVSLPAGAMANEEGKQEYH